MRGLPRAPPEPACICATHLPVLTAPAGGLRTMEVRHRDAKQRARGHTGARGGEGRHRQRVRPAPQRSPGTCPPSAVWEVPDPAVASPAAPSGPLTRRRRTACGAPGRFSSALTHRSSAGGVGGGRGQRRVRGQRGRVCLRAHGTLESGCCYCSHRPVGSWSPRGQISRSGSHGE